MKDDIFYFVEDELAAFSKVLTVNPLPKRPSNLAEAGWDGTALREAAEASKQ